MKVNPIQQQVLLKKLTEKWPAPQKCPVCQKNSWDIEDTFFEITEFHPHLQVKPAESKVQPLLPVICQNCGHTILFNAIVLGLY